LTRLFKINFQLGPVRKGLAFLDTGRLDLPAKI
jgi:hypothetical protein